MSELGPPLDRPTLIDDLDRFGAQDWDRRPTVRRGIDPELWADLLSLEDLDRILASRHTDVQILDRGIFRDPDGHRSPAAGRRRYDRTWLSDPAAVQRAFREGASILLGAADEWWPAIEDHRHRLAAALGANVNATVYVSPPGARSEWHHDVVHVFALQLHGHKRWLIEQDGPGRGGHHEPPMDVTVGPGDLLYVPRRFEHHVQAGDEVSVHITFSCETLLWSEVLARAVESVIADQAGPDEWGRRTPSDPRWGMASQARWEAEVRRAVAAVVEGLAVASPERIAEVAFTRGRTLRSTASGQFLRSRAVVELKPSDLIRLRPGAVVGPGPEAATVRLDLADRVLTLPSWLEPALRLLAAAEGPVRVDALGLEEADALVLARRLVLDEVCVTAPAHPAVAAT